MPSPFFSLDRSDARKVDDACSLAALGALSFDARQARAAEWYDAYPDVPRTIPDSAVRRAASFSTPPPPPLDELDSACARAQRTLRRMDAEALSAYGAVVYAALGSARAAMALIADIAMREIDWQLALLRPMYTVVLRTSPGPPAAAQSADKVVVQPEPRSCLTRKRKCRAPEARPRVPDTPRKRSKLASGAYSSTIPERSATPPPEGSRSEEVDKEGELGDEGDHDAPNDRGGRLCLRLTIGGRYLPQASERNKEEENTTTVQPWGTHVERRSLNLGPAGVPVPVRSYDGAAKGGRNTEHDRDSDLDAGSNHRLER